MKRLMLIAVTLLWPLACNQDAHVEEHPVTVARPPHEVMGPFPAYSYRGRLDGLREAPPLGYRASDIIYYWVFQGSADEQRLLLNHGFVVTGETYHQICSFYVHRSIPAFITTDSLLTAYFLTVEDALYKLELEQRDRLYDTITEYRRALKLQRNVYEARFPQSPGLAAATELDKYLTVASLLLSPDKMGEGIPKDVAAELRLIYAASSPARSPLRGIQLDYGRFEPRGLYAKKRMSDAGYQEGLWDPLVGGEPAHGGKAGSTQETLEGYYRAATWLHEVPFRVDSEDETRQALILAGLDAALDPGKSITSLNAPYFEFLGPSDDVGMPAYVRVFEENIGSFDLLAREPGRERAAREAVASLPQPRFTTIPDPAALEDPSKYRGLRLLPRPTLFDAEVFGPLAPFGLKRPIPSGEELMAVLGSSAAQEIVKNREGRVVPKYKELFEGAARAATEAEAGYSGDICRKRRALYRSLVKTPEDPALPPYYLHSAWRYKDLNTCLAAWAHHRYIWDLHGKRSAYYLCDNFAPPDAVVEPNVEFFTSLAALSEATGDFFSCYGRKEKRFAEIASLAKTLAAVAERQLAGEPLSKSQGEVLVNYGETLAKLCGFLGNVYITDETLPDNAFSTPVGADYYSGAARLVGQARPRALYVVCEMEGRKFLAKGGVLSYRDWVCGTAEANHLKDKEWGAAVENGEIPMPAWWKTFCSKEVGVYTERKTPGTADRTYDGAVRWEVVDSSGPAAAAFSQGNLEHKMPWSMCLSSCFLAYNGYLRMQPALAGELVVEFDVAESGEVLSCSAISSTLTSPTFEDEILSYIGATTFILNGKGGATCRVKFTFEKKVAPSVLDTTLFE